MISFVDTVMRFILLYRTAPKIPRPEINVYRTPPSPPRYSLCLVVVRSLFNRYLDASLAITLYNKAFVDVVGVVMSGLTLRLVW